MGPDDAHEPAPMLAYSAPDSVPPHWTNTSLHKSDPSHFWPAYFKAMGLWLLLRLARLAVVGVAFWLLNPLRDIPSLQRTVFIWIGVVLGISILITGILRYFRTRKYFATHEIVIADQGLLRRGGDMPALEFTCDEITRINAHRFGLIVVAGNKAKRRIALLGSLERYGDVCARLKTWNEIPWVSMSNFRLLGEGMLILTLGCLSAASAITIFWTGSIVIAATALLCLLGISAYASWATARNANLTTFRKTLTFISLGIGATYLTLVFIMRFAFPH